MISRFAGMPQSQLTRGGGFVAPRGQLTTNRFFLRFAIPGFTGTVMAVALVVVRATPVVVVLVMVVVVVVVVFMAVVAVRVVLLVVVLPVPSLDLSS